MSTSKIFKAMQASLTLGLAVALPALASPMPDHYYATTAGAKKTTMIKARVEQTAASTQTVQPPTKKLNGSAKAFDMNAPVDVSRPHSAYMGPDTPVSNPSGSMVSDGTPVVHWFENFDDMEDRLQVSKGDKAALTMPVGQEAEKVRDWIQRAARVSRDYRKLSFTLKKMNVPQGMDDVKQFRDLSSDWYLAASDVLYDCVKPRKPARTIEELNRQLDEVKQRSDQLKISCQNLQDMDHQLREHYHVHEAKQKDALAAYVNGR